MKLQFKDFYGQYVTIHNETGTGNVRLSVGTCDNMNEVHTFKSQEECPIQTDISLTEEMVEGMISALKMDRIEK